MRSKTAVNHGVTSSLLAGMLVLGACGDGIRHDMADHSADSMSTHDNQAGMMTMDAGMDPGVAADGMGPDGQGMMGIGTSVATPLQEAEDIRERLAAR